MKQDKDANQKVTPEPKKAKVTEQKPETQELQVEELEERIAPITFGGK